MTPDEPVVVARIVRAHGVRGGLLLDPETDHAEALFQPGRRLRVAPGTGEGGAYTVRSARPHGRRWLIEFEEVADRAEAERARGAELVVPRGELPHLEPGGILLGDLIGMTLLDGAEERGVVTDVYDLPAGPLLEVAVGDEAERRLVPFHTELVERVDGERRALHMRLPEGLFEL